MLCSAVDYAFPRRLVDVPGCIENIVDGLAGIVQKLSSHTAHSLLCSIEVNTRIKIRIDNSVQSLGDLRQELFAFLSSFIQQIRQGGLSRLNEVINLTNNGRVQVTGNHVDQRIAQEGLASDLHFLPYQIKRRSKAHPSGSHIRGYR